MTHYDSDDQYNQIPNISTFATCNNTEYVIKAIECLISNGDNVNIVDENYDTPLIIACRLNNIELVKFLVKYGADINLISNNHSGDWSLSVALDHDGNEIAKYLILQGVDLVKNNTINDTDNMAIHIIMKTNNIELIVTHRNINNYIIEYNEEYTNLTMLMIACRYAGNLEIIKYLINHGAHIYAIDNIHSV